MTFLNTAILFGLIAAAIPIIIHFLTRQKVKTVHFSSLRFLKKLEFQQIRRLKIKQILLLILRTLIILLLILAFARPTVKEKEFNALGTAAETSAVIILDNSLSMAINTGGQKAFDVAKNAAIGVTELFKTGDEIFGLYATEKTPYIFEGARYNIQTIQKIIRKSKLSQKKTDVTSALIKATQILQNSSNLNKEIYLISDLQQTGFDNVDKTLMPIIKDENIKLFVIPIMTDKFNNVVVTEVRPRNQIIEKGKVFELETAIYNAGGKQIRDELIQVYIDGNRSSQTSVDLDPGETKTTKFRIVPRRTGIISGSVQIGEDDLFYDNKRYFTLAIPDVIKVLLISEQEKDNTFLRLALNPTQERGAQIKTDLKTPEQIEFDTIKNYQVVILSNVSKIEGILLSSIIKHVESGGGLVIFPGSRVDLRQYNENLNDKLLLPLFTETIGEYGSKKYSMSLGDIDFGHPIFSGVFEENNQQVESPQFYFYTKVKTQPENDIIMKFSDGEPFLLEDKYESGKIMLFTSTIDPNWSDLYLKGLFVPLINRCVAYVSAEMSQQKEAYIVDDELNTVIGGITNYTDFKIESPTGSITKVVPTVSGGDLRIQFNETKEAGIYKLYHHDQLITKWAVNIDPIESNLTPINDEELKKVAGKASIISYKNNDILIEEIETSRFGKEFWKYLIGIIIVLLLLEMILAREGKKTESQTNLEEFESA